jgi:hypothetical protein
LIDKKSNIIHTIIIHRTHQKEGAAAAVGVREYTKLGREAPGVVSSEQTPWKWGKEKKSVGRLLVYGER